MCSGKSIGRGLVPSFVVRLGLTIVCRQQPWCTYALHIATFTSLAFLFDPLLLFSCWWGTENWELKNRYILLGAEVVFMFCFTKVVKLVGLFRRNPSDIMFLPVSILFGYFHGLIKLWALFTLKEVFFYESPLIFGTSDADN